MIGFDPTPHGNKFGAMKDLMTSKTEHQQHKKPRNGFRIEHQKIHPRTDWANRQILKNCEQQTSDLWRATRWFPFYFSESSSIGTSSKSQTHQSSSKLQAPALCSSGGIIPDSSLSQEDSGRFQPDPLDQEHRFHPRSSWERPSGDVSSHVSPTQRVSLVDENLEPVMGRIFLKLGEGITHKSWIFDVFD